jgi:hypothetical protein
MMPTTIAIESKDVTIAGISTSFQHLYLVKTVTDSTGTVIDERVILGNLGADGTVVTLADVPLANSPDARGSENLAERHRTPLDLEGRNPEDVWSLMVQHARNIDDADLPYGLEVFGIADPDEVNSNTVVASVLYTVGISLVQNFPSEISTGQAPLYNRLGAMDVDDLLFGSARSDIILGGVGNDRLTGRRGDDRLSGEDGRDVLVGGLGRDVLVGGIEADRFDFNAVTESLTSQPDVIRDFQGGSDTLDLRGVDAVLGSDGDQSFVYIGKRGFTGQGGELRFEGGLLQGDRNGDTAVDFAIKFSNITALAAFDVLL